MKTTPYTTYRDHNGDEQRTPAFSQTGKTAPIHSINRIKERKIKPRTRIGQYLESLIEHQNMGQERGGYFAQLIRNTDPRSRFGKFLKNSIIGNSVSQGHYYTSRDVKELVANDTVKIKKDEEGQR